MAIAIGLLKTLLELAEARKTGALDARGPAARVRIFVDKGQIVFAEEGSVGETLGRILLRENVLTDDQYASAIEWMSEAVSQGQSIKLGEVLLQLKMIGKEQLEAALSAQVRQKVVRALSWTTVRTTFIECHGALEIDGRYQTTLEPLVLAAVRNADAMAIDELFAQSRTRFVSLRGDRTAGGGTARMRTIARLAAFQMPRAEDSLARSLDGSRTIAEVMSADGAIVLAALLLTDCLDLHPYAQAPRLERRKSSGNALQAVKGPPKVLPPRPAPRPRPSSRPSKRPPSSLFGFEAFEAPTTPRVPGVAPPKPTTASGLLRLQGVRPSARAPAPDEKRRAQKVATKLKASRAAKQRALPPPMPDALPLTPATPMAPLAPMARLLAEKAFQLGKKHLRANAMGHAAEEMRRAAQLYAAPEYQLWAAWATLRANPKNEMEHAALLQEAAERALDDDAELGFGWYALGWVAKKNGEHGRAAELFERARALDSEAVELAHDVRLKLATPQAFVTPSRSLTGLPAVRPPTQISSAPPPVFLAAPIAGGGAGPDGETRGELRALGPPMSTPMPAGVVASDQRSDVALQQEREGGLMSPGHATPRMMPAPPPVGALTESGRISGPPSTPRVVAPPPPPPPPPSSRRGPPPVPSASTPRSATMPISAPTPTPTTPIVRPATPASPWPSSQPRMQTMPIPLSSTRLPVAGAGAGAGAAGAAESTPSVNRFESSQELHELPEDSDRAPRGGGSRSAIFGAIAVMVLAIGAGVLWLRRPAPQTDVPIVVPTGSVGATATVTVTPSTPSAEVAPSLDAAAADAMSDSTMIAIDAAVADARAEAAAGPSTDEIPAGQGALDFPAGAAGHRVFVDGRVVGEPPAAMFVSCGAHQIKVGSRGNERAIVVPCGSRVNVPYP